MDITELGRTIIVASPNQINLDSTTYEAYTDSACYTHYAPIQVMMHGHDTWAPRNS